MYPSICPESCVHPTSLFVRLWACECRNPWVHACTWLSEGSYCEFALLSMIPLFHLKQPTKLITTVESQKVHQPELQLHLHNHGSITVPALLMQHRTTCRFLLLYLSGQRIASKLKGAINGFATASQPVVLPLILGALHSAQTAPLWEVPVWWSQQNYIISKTDLILTLPCSRLTTSKRFCPWKLLTISGKVTFLIAWSCQVCLVEAFSLNKPLRFKLFS